VDRVGRTVVSVEGTGVVRRARRGGGHPVIRSHRGASRPRTMITVIASVDVDGCRRDIGRIVIAARRMTGVHGIDIDRIDVDRVDVDRVPCMGERSHLV